MMVTENYDKLSPNAKRLALQKEKQRIEEQIKELETQYTKCQCGYLFDIKTVKCEYEEYTKRSFFPDFGEWEDGEYRDVKYAETVFYCPVCGNRHIRNHFYIGVE